MNGMMHMLMLQVYPREGESEASAMTTDPPPATTDEEDHRAKTPATPPRPCSAAREGGESAPGGVIGVQQQEGEESATGLAAERPPSHTPPLPVRSLQQQQQDGAEAESALPAPPEQPLSARTLPLARRLFGFLFGRDKGGVRSAPTTARASEEKAEAGPSEPLAALARTQVRHALCLKRGADDFVRCQSCTCWLLC